MDTTIGLTVAEAARRLAISRSKMYELIAHGAMPTFTIGRCRRIRPEALQEFARRREAETASQGRTAK